MKSIDWTLGAQQRNALLAILELIGRLTDRAKAASCLHIVPMEEAEFDHHLGMLETARSILETTSESIEGLEDITTQTMRNPDTEA